MKRDVYDEAVDAVILYLTNDKWWHDQCVDAIEKRASPIDMIYQLLKSQAWTVKNGAGVSATVKWNRVAVRLVQHYCDTEYTAYEAFLRKFASKYTWFRLQDYLKELHLPFPTEPDTTNPVYALKGEEDKMKKLHETRHYINGVDVKDMSADQMIDNIAALEAEIVKLESIATESKAIKAKIKELKAAIKFTVKHLDAK